MNNVSFILTTALATALRTVTGRTVYQDNNIQLDKTLMFPHIAISDVFITEDGPKTSLHYRAEVLLEVVHKQISSMAVLHSDINNVLSIVNNGVPFALESPFEIMDCTLNNVATTKATNERGLMDIGLIRLIFRIK